MMDAAVFEGDVREAMAGDAEAFRRVVEASASTVCSIALAIVRNGEASEDIAQEVYLAVWQNLARLRNPRSFLPWIRQITRNHARSFLRQRREEFPSEELLASVADPVPAADEMLVRSEEEKILSRAIDELPDDTREIVLVYYREGSSTREVARLLGLSEEAVRQRLSRARARIREEMLRQLGEVARRTAPGAAFLTAVLAATTASAPAASAAVLASGGKAGGTTAASKLLLFAKAAGLGAILGAFGVFMSLVHLGSPFDEKEARALRRLATQAFAIVMLFCLAFAVADASGSRVWRVAVLLTYYVAMIVLYRKQLPRILARRYEWERSVDPEAAARQDKAWSVWTNGEMAQALGAAATGGLLFSLLLHMWRS